MFNPHRNEGNRGQSIKANKGQRIQFATDDLVSLESRPKDDGLFNAVYGYGFSVFFPQKDVVLNHAAHNTKVTNDKIIFCSIMIDTLFSFYKRLSLDFCQKLRTN